MRALTRSAGAGALLVIAVAITGCTPQPGPDRPTEAGPSRTPIPVATEPPTERPTTPIEEATSYDIGIDVYDEGFYRTEKDCGCPLKVPEMGIDVPEAFPRGSVVWMLRFAVTSTKGLQQEGETWDETGSTIVSAQFAERPELAVEDPAGGLKKAKQLSLPYGLDGLMPKEGKWILTNDKPQSFLLAYYVPLGAEQLDMVVNFPTDPEETSLKIDIPRDVMAAAAAASGGGNE